MVVEGEPVPLWWLRGATLRSCGNYVTSYYMEGIFFFFLLLRERINQMRGEKQRRGEGADVCVCASGPRSSPGPALPPPT